ncbi:hypothetical protein [Streptomyces sp. SCSIO ZS0520]|uniref:hypothetical protein n=1 Tax=Streptomyces sp. SCSIO ZS0520 TaxID=2892996 RepID=UPI0021DA07D6|nr:hypothetical protein [Streptomyces sp. SCSIO ZS0520]
MPTHKMLTIDGIRVRAEDEDRYRARSAPAPGPLTQTMAQPAPPLPPADPDLFNPSDHTLPQVIAYLAEADEEESARILDEEAQGEKRKGLLERRDEFLAEARQRAAGSGGGA